MDAARWSEIVRTAQESTADDDRVCVQDCTCCDSDTASHCEAFGSKAMEMSTDEMRSLFTVESFCMGLVFVTRKSDGVRGTLDFTHMPRAYFNFLPRS